MAITFLPNDPDVAQLPPVNITPSSDRPAGRSGVVITGLPAQSQYAVHTREFAIWQAREVALRTLEVFETACGPLPGWGGVASRRTLPLNADYDQEINARYSGQSLNFYYWPTPTGTVYTGASADVVAHEVGHAILDALRPDMWMSDYAEVSAFHEGFADCIAIVHSLSDRRTRDALLAAGTSLRERNFVETLGERIAKLVRDEWGEINESAPRRAYNDFQWAFPESLPGAGAPGTLIGSSQSLGQIVSGIFYDLICAIYESGPPGEAQLSIASATALKLAVGSIRNASIKLRFFESWGRDMLLFDRNETGGAHSAYIRAAFSDHGIAVSATSYLAPRAMLATAPLTAKGKGLAMLSSEARKTLLTVFGHEDRKRLQARSVEIGARRLSQVESRRDVDLTGVAEALAGVTVSVPQVALIGDAGRGTAILGGIDLGFACDAEVRAHVAALVERGHIDFGGRRRKRGGETYVDLPGVITHAVRRRGGKKVLKRVAFACGCSAHRRRIGTHMTE